MSLDDIRVMTEHWDRDPEHAMNEVEGALDKGIGVEEMLRRYVKVFDLDPESAEVEEFRKVLHHWYTRAKGETETDIIRNTLSRYIHRENPPVEIVQWATSQGIKLPRIKSGIGSLDVLTGGGVGGVTLISGSPKIGKSYLVNMLRCEAALAGWRVGDVDAELTIENRTSRVYAYAGNRFERADWQRITPIKVSEGATARDIIGMIEGVAASCEGRLLGIVDSVNTVATMGGEDYFRTIESIGRAASLTTRESGGRIAWVLVSELNNKGGAKGGKLDYWCDFHIKIERGGGKGRILKLALSRHSADGNLGTFAVRPEMGCLEFLEMDDE